MQTIIAYNKDEVTEPKQFEKSLETSHNVWIDLVDPSEETFQSFATIYNLDKNALELYKNKSKKSQIRSRENHTFTILLDLKYKDPKTVVTEAVYLFCGKRWMITIHSERVDVVKSIRKLLEEKNKNIMKDSLDALYYSIVAEMIDRYERVLTAVELTVSDEQKSLENPVRESLGYLDTLSRQLIVFRRHFWRVRDVVNFLTHMEEDKDEVKYIQMAYDNITQLIQLVESYRDTINSVRDLYIASISSISDPYLKQVL